VTLLGQLRGVRNGIENPAVPLSSPALLEYLGVQSSGSGQKVTELSALGLAAVTRAITVTCNVPASLPLHCYRQDGDERKAATGWGARLVDDPHPDLTPYELWQLMWVHRRLWGNAYLRKLRNQLGQIVELWPIHPSRVKVGRSSETGLKVYSIDGGREVFIGDDAILHVPGLGYDGITGLSPIRLARESIGLGLAAQEYGSKLFGSGSLATGILQTEQRLTQKQADALHDRWKSKRTGMDSAHDTIVLDRGAKFTQLTIPPGDAQFLESRRFQVVEVCRWFNLPPFLMFETEKSTSWGTGLEQQALGWVMFDLRPDLIALEQRVTKMIKPEPVYARHSIEGLLRGDSTARANFYRTMWNLGALSTNEIRSLEELSPVEGGDVRYRPLNMGELGTTDSSDAGASNPAPDPVADPTPPADNTWHGFPIEEYFHAA
jgi:HK97 family phage portal protein